MCGGNCFFDHLNGSLTFYLFIFFLLLGQKRAISVLETFNEILLARKQ